jgi:hypothetical protein
LYPEYQNEWCRDHAPPAGMTSFSDMATVFDSPSMTSAGFGRTLPDWVLCQANAPSPPAIPGFEPAQNR